jgi:hypothetical protein
MLSQARTRREIYGYDSPDHSYPVINWRIAYMALQLRMGLLSKRRAWSVIIDRLDPRSLQASLMHWEVTKAVEWMNSAIH